MIESSLLTTVLMLVRVTCFLSAVPLFSSKTLPHMVKIGLAIALTAMWTLSARTTAAHIDPSLAGNWLGFGILVASELLIGVTMGMAFGIFHLPARIAGAYLAQEMGVNMSATADANTGQSTTIMASLFEAIAVLMFFGLNMHYLLFRALDTSFERLPVGTPITKVPGIVVIDTFTQMDQIGLSVVAPVVICLLVGLVFLLLLNKASPALNLFSLGLTIRIAAGLFALLLLMPQICQAIQNSFRQGEVLIFDLLDVLF